MSKPSESVRLHKRIAESGLCSRRAAEKLIAEGRVMVNGTLITEMGVSVEPHDEVSVDGQILVSAKTYTLIMNKPPGVVTTLSDPQGRPTVRKLLPDLGVQLKPVGRLDMESEGLILFTNDGELANRLTHPRWKVEKEYEVLIQGNPVENQLDRLRRGVLIEGGKTKPAIIERMGRGGETTKLRFILKEGKKRQIRLMCHAMGHNVIRLQRVRIGPLRLHKMPRGMCRMLSQVELKALKALVGLESE